jgi:Na+:H+ antiporter, NhaA family
MSLSNKLEEFIQQESFSGIILIFSTLAALILKNSPWSDSYNTFLHTPVEVRFGALQIHKPLLLWVNDGLMAVFFLLVGLEVKREILEGELSSWNQVALPGIAALGGMLIPALVFVGFNWGRSFDLTGWAIPTATDIAFALGILSLLGSRVPASLKIFLMSLAIIDDLGAIVIIALFYTLELSWLSIGLALGALLILTGMNRAGVSKKGGYFLLGSILWVSVLKSGVHATLAGVALAFTIPSQAFDRSGNPVSPASQIEQDLHPWVAFLILPLFAFVNAGVDLSRVSLQELLGPVPLGILLGLFIGKQVGVFGFSWLAIKLKLATLPAGSSFRTLYGVSILTGIGFTMSLFIDTLAYQDTQVYQFADKLAILIGSFFSGLVGYTVLKKASRRVMEPERI